MDNQASEDEQRTLDDILSQAFTDGASDTMWQNDKHVEIFATAKKELQSLIRTEKLKAQIAILQEGISESKEFCGEDVDINLGWVNFKLNKLQQSLTKREAEL